MAFKASEWQNIIDAVNAARQNPPASDCSPLPPIDPFDPSKPFKRSEVERVRNALKETCPSISFSEDLTKPIKTTWFSEITDQINQAWCDCDCQEDIDSFIIEQWEKAYILRELDYCAGTQPQLGDIPFDWLSAAGALLDFPADKAGSISIRYERYFNGSLGDSRTLFTKTKDCDGNVTESPISNPGTHSWDFKERDSFDIYCTEQTGTHECPGLFGGTIRYRLYCHQTIDDCEGTLPPLAAISDTFPLAGEASHFPPPFWDCNSAEVATQRVLNAELKADFESHHSTQVWTVRRRFTCCPKSD